MGLWKSGRSRRTSVYGRPGRAVSSRPASRAASPERGGGASGRLDDGTFVLEDPLLVRNVVCTFIKHVDQEESLLPVCRPGTRPRVPWSMPNAVSIPADLQVIAGLLKFTPEELAECTAAVQKRNSVEAVTTQAVEKSVVYARKLVGTTISSTMGGISRGLWGVLTGPAQQQQEEQEQQQGEPRRNEGAATV